MTILAIESTCDETGVSIVESANNVFNVKAHVVLSQRETHNKYGGVVPEVAGRLHAENIAPAIEKAMEKHNSEIDAVASASGPGLSPCLVAGVEAAKTLSFALKKKLIAVNHMEGHLYSISNYSGAIENKNGCAFLEDDLPVLFLSVSGGHTELILMKGHGRYKLIGKTRDDAAGEAFDKTAKLLGLKYPGGPEISRFAKKGNPKAFNFPRPMIQSKNFDFSFAGLKTAVKYELQKNKKINKNDIAASFEQAVCDVLVYKTLNAAKNLKVKSIGVVGGVSANKNLKSAFHNFGVKIYFPQKELSGDNATMIGIAAHYNALRKNYTTISKIKADPNWELY